MTECWYVEWSQGEFTSYPKWRIFYSDHGKSFKDALHWFEEKQTEFKYVTLHSGICNGTLWPTINNIPIKTTKQ